MLLVSALVGRFFRRMYCLKCIRGGKLNHCHFYGFLGGLFAGEKVGGSVNRVGGNPFFNFIGTTAVVALGPFSEPLDESVPSF